MTDIQKEVEDEYRVKLSELDEIILLKFSSDPRNINDVLSSVAKIQGTPKSVVISAFSELAIKGLIVGKNGNAHLTDIGLEIKDSK